MMILNHIMIYNFKQYNNDNFKQYNNDNFTPFNISNGDFIIYLFKDCDVNYIICLLLEKLLNGVSYQ